jgi:DNA-binding NarL/FixJ family response regulator
VNPKLPYRVLICDDTAVIREAVQLALTGNPEFAVVGEAAGGRESIVMAVRFRPDLVLMDVHMPDLDGPEATRLLLLGLPGIKILAYSADTDWETVDRMFAAGAAGYVVKGGHLEELVRAARTIVTGGHYLSLALLDPTVLN